MDRSMRAVFDAPIGRAQPRAWRFLLATAGAVGLALVVCRLVAFVFVAADPSLAGYEHFAFPDYAKLTVIGVTLACLAWPVVTLSSSRARAPFLVLTIAVTAASFAPDVWIGLHGQPVLGVTALALMHVGVAAVTYPVLVFGAPQRLTVSSGRA